MPWASLDWGVPVNGIPVLPSTVTRLHLLEQVREAIGKPADGNRVEHLVAQGQTGYGKSSLAAHFCHLYRNSYEFICWIDCSDPGLIEANLRRFVQELTRTEIPLTIDPSKVFAKRSPLIEDPGLSSSTAFRPVPILTGVSTQGNGCVLVKTTESRPAGGHRQRFWRWGPSRKTRQRPASLVTLASMRRTNRPMRSRTS